MPFLLLLVLLAGCAHEGTAQASREAVTVPAITDADLRVRVAIFADDSMQGRAAGSPGHERALAYVVHELKRLGLRPAGDKGTYLQRVPLPGAGRDTLWSHNVVAVLPGRDSMLDKQYVAIGAHSDHIGVQRRAVDHDSLRAVNQALWEKQGRVAGAPSVSLADREAIIRAASAAARAARGARPARMDSINNGADDDGSGSMALLELAEQFASQPVPPSRSLLFVWHTGEEIGLNGAEWFVQHPAVPLSQIVAQVNIDMIGRGSARDIAGGGDGYLGVIGSGRLSSELAQIVKDVNRQEPTPLALDYALDAVGHPENIYCRSDHALYASRGIPIVFFFTNIHQDYHEVTDEAQYLDYPHYARITRYIGSVVRSLANRATAPVVNMPRPDPRAPCRQ